MRKRSDRIRAERENKYFSLKKQMRQEATKGLVVAGLAIGLTSYLTQSAQVLADEISTTTKRYHSNEFINQIAKPAMEIAKKKDLYTSVMIAQAALESGWGQSTLAKAPNHNLFGVKGEYQGQSVTFDTLEDAGGQNYYQIKAGFRKYPNYDASLNDYAYILTGDDNPDDWRYNFYKGARRSNTKSYRDATAWLTGRYATDNGYAGKLNQIIESNQLTQFDGEFTPHQLHSKQAEEKRQFRSATPAPQALTTPTTATTVVKAGDGFYAIASRCGVSVDALLKANNLTIGSMIHPGQELKLPGQVVSTTQPIVKKEQKQAPKDHPIKKENQKASIDLKAVQQTKEQVKPTAPQLGQAVVKPGDGFYAIASRYGVPVNELLAANGMTLTTMIHPNQVLKLPVKTLTTQPLTPQPEVKVVPKQEVKSVPTPKTKQKLTPQPTVKTTVRQSHTQVQSGGAVVKAGDGFYAIASRYGVSVNDLLAVNGLQIGSMIHPGQVLKLPGRASAPVTTPTPRTTTQQSVVNPTLAPAPIQNRAQQPVRPVAPQQLRTNTSTSGKTVVVEAGQGLWRIAQNNGMTLDQLKALNGLTSNMIHPGQVLKVK
ncbi:LysM peptidoglycan-binding domain-containing protein [Atopobacter phocae]|uniref:LysM peptidoglycan-binding domain-containing protein n=1 Tax=Atopobacter phocae TaxID=136492 RepID=UPI00046FBFAE|nr:LysM peptidoglycan-binding domain-containing protein [Atopobacter phocae]